MKASFWRCEVENTARIASQVTDCTSRGRMTRPSFADSFLASRKCASATTPLNPDTPVKSLEAAPARAPDSVPLTSGCDEPNGENHDAATECVSTVTRFGLVGSRMLP